MNVKIREHAATIWTKVEELQETSQAPLIQAPSPTNNSVRQSVTENPRVESSNLAGELEFKRKVYRDQILYLTEALNLPTSGTVEEQWAELRDSDVCQAMKDMSRWQTSLEKLSSTFREYEKLNGSVGPLSTFETDSEEFEDIRNRVKEVTLAVKKEDTRRNLQTLLPLKSDKVKYPTFSGDIGEDYIKFKEKVMDCFIKKKSSAQ